MEADYIQPDVRKHLITESLRFVLVAHKLPGVIRIALIGSLTTDKKNPKDADLLLTVKDDMKLNNILIAEPPLELWPEVMVRVPIPRDVEQYLVLPLKS